MARGILLFCLLFFSFSMIAGTLDDFEKDVITTPETKSKSNPSSSSKKSSNKRHEKHRSIYSSSYSNCDVFLGCFMDELFWRMMEITVLVAIEGGKMSVERTQGVDDTLSSMAPRTIGEPLLPFIRFDAHYQNAKGDVSGIDLKLELGYSLLGINLRRARFRELSPSDELDLSYIHGLYRMSLGNHVGLNVGYGRATLKGEQKSSGSSVTFPLLFHWSERLGIEGSYTASKINRNWLKDTEISLVVTERFASLSFGYRSIRGPFKNLQGPFMGLSVHW